MRLLLVRHAESQGNSEMRIQGRREFPLTERGLEQARALAGRLSIAGVSAIYSSPLGRAMQTARVIAEKTGVQVVPEPRAQEYDFGETISGLTWQQVWESHPHVVRAVASDGTAFPQYPGEEGRAEFSQRVCSAIGEIAHNHAADGAVVIVTDAGAVAAYLMDVLGRRYARPVPFTIDNASITTVEFGPGLAAGMPQRVLVGLNDTCHLLVVDTMAEGSVRARGER